MGAMVPLLLNNHMFAAGTNYIRGEGRGVLSWEHISEFQQDPVGTMAKYNASIIALPVPTGGEFSFGLPLI